VIRSLFTERPRLGVWLPLAVALVGLVSLILGLATMQDVRREREFFADQAASRGLAGDSSVDTAVDDHLNEVIRSRIWRGVQLAGGMFVLSYLIAVFLSRSLRRADTDLREQVAGRQQADKAVLVGQERFRLLFEDNPVAMALVSLEGKYLAVNGRLAEMLGRTSEEMLAMTVFDVTDKEYGHWALDLPKTNSDVSYMETQYVTADDNRIWVGVSTAVATDEHDEPAFGITTVQDVSGRKREQDLEKRHLTSLELHASQIRERYEEAERLRRTLEDENTRRKRFLNVLSHELRTPLTPILSSGHMLEELLRPDPRSGEGRLLDNLLSGAKTLKSRIDDLVDQASYEAGEYQLNTEPVDIPAVLHDMVELLRPEADSRNQTLELEVGDDLPTIEADGKRLQQALVNLVSNALKFGPDGKPVVIRAFAEGDVIVFEVRDYGPGIPRQYLDLLFTPYFRREHDRRQHRGLGLGLTIVKQIVESHGGEVKVESRPGEGALFRIRLPVAVPRPPKIAGNPAEPGNWPERLPPVPPKSLPESD
jgi:two-component system, chemotaxis family, CheB/CheR fusion protein